MRRFDLSSSAIRPFVLSILSAWLPGAASAGTPAAAAAPGAPSAVSTASAPSAAAASATQAAAGTPASSESSEKALHAERLERWLDDGDRDLVIQTFRRHPEEVLAFFDGYLETGLKHVEQRAHYEDAMKHFRRGLKFAQAATEAWRDPIFADYAASFASWNDAERKRFRRGQQAYKAGAIALRTGNAAEAKARFQEALDLAEPLGDAWGTQMSLTGLARAATALEEWSAVNDAGQRAIDLSARLQLRHAEIENCLICVEARKRLETHDSGAGHGGQAWRRLHRSDPPELRARVGEAFAAALERIGRAEEAAKVRAETGVPDATDPETPAGTKPAGE